MAFNSSLYLLVIITPLFLFSLPSSTFSLSIPHQPAVSPRGVLVEEKTRLGSTPPRCYSKCNQCHPCTAVQVPTLPSLHRVQPPPSSQNERSTRSSAVEVFEYDKSYGDNDRYSNYKPLGWKCRCKDHFYNP